MIQVSLVKDFPQDATPPPSRWTFRWKLGRGDRSFRPKRGGEDAGARLHCGVCAAGPRACSCSMTFCCSMEEPVSIGYRKIGAVHTCSRTMRFSAHDGSR